MSAPRMYIHFPVAVEGRTPHRKQDSAHSFRKAELIKKQYSNFMNFRVIQKKNKKMKKTEFLL